MKSKSDCHGATGNLGLLCYLLSRPSGPYIVQPQFYQGFSDACAQFNDWEVSSLGERQIGISNEILHDQIERSQRVEWSKLPSRELVSTVHSLRSLDDPIVKGIDWSVESQRHFAAFAHWRTSRRPEDEWRVYAWHLARLPVLRGEYTRRMERTPIGQAIYTIFVGDPRETERQLETIVEILRQKLWPWEASEHPDPRIRREETEAVLRVFVIERLMRLEQMTWLDWLPEILDGKVVSPRVARNKIVDAYRKAERHELGAVSLTDYDEVPDAPPALLPEELQVQPDGVEMLALLRRRAAETDRVCGDLSAGMCEYIVEAGSTRRPTQRDIAAAVGCSPRTVFDRLSKMSRSAALRDLLSN